MDTYVLIISNKYCNFSLSEYVSMYFRFTKKELIREVEYKIGALLWKLTSALLGKCKKVWYYEKWVGRLFLLDDLLRHICLLICGLHMCTVEMHIFQDAKNSFPIIYLVKQNFSNHTKIQF